MSVHFLKSRKLWFSKWRDEDGKEKRRYFKTEQEARAYEAERNEAQAFHDGRLTLGELAVLYVKSNPDKHARSRAILRYLLAGGGNEEHHIEGPAEFLRDKYAECLNRQDLERLREICRSRGNGNNTINHYQAYIRAVLAWGADQELIRNNPWRDFKKLKIIKPPIQVNIADFKNLYQCLPPYLQWAVKTAFFLALRPGQVELFSLTWDAFNWRRGIVTIRQGKSGKLKTVVPAEFYLVEARERFEQDMAHGIPLVCHRNGNHVLSFRTAWLTACRKARVKMRPYDIRHLAATEMLANGADLAAVAAQLGHQSVTTTGSTYAHITAGSQARAAALMPELGRGDTNGDTR